MFGVKDSLVVDLHEVGDPTAKKYDVKPGSLVLTHDFVLVSDKEATDLRDEKSKKALAALGRKIKLLNGLPVPDVD